jgi:hypothetical protein
VYDYGGSRRYANRQRDPETFTLQVLCVLADTQA